ncbi:MAG: hypothetical protein HC918_09240 [Oscillatoriales cyanobacterium SM2_1_8]|nr:hypothetical protein [Oscillatoriales cyanobacterium SM2_1_8]
MSTTADNFGRGEIDTLTGGAGSDVFVLGDSRRAFYLGTGAQDYALITDFNPATDFLQVHGGSVYTVGAAPAGLPTGAALFVGNDLVAILTGVDPANSAAVLARFRPV